MNLIRDILVIVLACWVAGVGTALCMTAVMERRQKRKARDTSAIDEFLGELCFRYGLILEGEEHE